MIFRTKLRTGNEDTIAGAQETVLGAQNEGDTGFQIGEEMTKHVDAAANAMSDFITGTKSAKEAFKDFAKGVIAEITKMIIKQLILNALQAASGGGGGGSGMGAIGSMGGMSGGGGNMGSMMGSMGSMAGNGGGGTAGFLGGFMSGGLNHTGGHIGAGSATRQIPASWLSSMKRYHTGGEILSPGEVPIVAQEGEYMLDKYDIRNPKNGGSGDAREGNGGGGSQAVNITNVVDNASIAGSMQKHRW